MAKISVIVPVYNVEEYLEECLESLINQTLTDIEIICINDGSTDNSLNILKKYEKKDGRIKIINQINKGLGASRNVGIELAEGEYISFIDSDDFLELNSYEKLYTICKEKNLDIIMFQLINYDDEKEEYYQSDYYDMKKIEDIIRDNVFNYKDLNEKMFSIPVSACNKLYNREFIIKNNFMFPENTAFEDNPFFWNVFLSAEKIFFYKKHLYKRRRHLNSITGNKGKNHVDSIKINNLIFKIFYDFHLFKNYKSILYNMKIKTVFTRYLNIKEEYKELFFKEMKTDFNKIITHKNYIDFIMNINKKNKKIFEYVLFSKTYQDFDLFAKNLELIEEIDEDEIYSIILHQQLLKYNTARIDIKNMGNKNNTIKLIEKSDMTSKISFPSWMKTDKGMGMAIESFNGNIYLKFKCVNNGELDIVLKGLYIKDKKEELFPIYIDYTSLTINGEEQLKESQLTWFREPYKIKKEVKDGEIIEVNIKWNPFTKNSFYKNTKVLQLKNKNTNQKQEIKKLKAENKKLKNKNKKLKEKNKAILSSTSWKLTKPLRNAKNKLTNSGKNKVKE